jgi:hypothetical protein
MIGVTEHSRRVDAVSWAVFFIWIGVALLMNIGWAWALLGISAIVLGTQAALHLSGDKVEVFWIACGAVLLASAIWLMLGLTWPLAPVLLVVLGIVMLGNSLFGGQPR